ncbi:MAG: flagellar basal body rod protein FlgB [bacterium]|nr:flagellar basal body rod protein FlgB [bacterium]
MFEKSEFMKMNYLLQRAMDTSLVRHKVISDNIANVDTPNFKKSSVTFESQLKRALDSEDIARREPQGYITNDRHIPFNRPVDYRQVGPKIQVEYDTNYRNDKNNVDIEKEMTDAVVNTLRYRALVDKMKMNYRMLNMAMS